MPSDAKGRDPGRRQKKAVESVDSEDSGGEHQLYSQVRSHHTKKPQPRGNIVINGDVHIKNLNDFNVIHGRGDEARPQRTLTPVRNASRRLQPHRKVTRSTARSDSPSASDDETTTCNDESEAENGSSKRSAKLIRTPERPRLHSEKKREQRDEGYHTSGTVSAYTAQVPAKVKGEGKAKVRGKERSVSSVGSLSIRPRQSSGSRESREGESETDATSYHSDGQDQDDISVGGGDATDRNGHLEDEEASDDDFGKLSIHVANPNNLDASGIGTKAILDTGSKEDWISQIFYDQIRETGVRLTKLSSNEQETQYRDFNGKRFKPTGRVNLMIQSDEFKGPMKCRPMWFFVASKATFSILFGRETIRKHAIFVRSKLDTEGEEVLIGVHSDLTEGAVQKAELKKKREEQKRLAQERKKARDDKTERAVRQKESSFTPSAAKVATNLATTVPRPRKARSPPGESSRQSSSSMDGTW